MGKGGRGFPWRRAPPPRKLVVVAPRHHGTIDICTGTGDPPTNLTAATNQNIISATARLQSSLLFFVSATARLQYFSFLLQEQQITVTINKNNTNNHDNNTITTTTTTTTTRTRTRTIKENIATTIVIMTHLAISTILYPMPRVFI